MSDHTAGPADNASDDTSPWLSERQQGIWRAFLSMTRRIDETVERDMQRRGGMPFAYYLILAMLSETPGQRVRMNQLAEIVGYSQSRLSHAITRIEELGWVQREQASADKRGQYAILTPAGQRRLDELAPLHARTVKDLVFTPLSDQQLSALDDIVSTIQNAGPAEDVERTNSIVHMDMAGRSED